MSLYGILKSSDPHNGNTGLDNELCAVFTTPLSIDSNRYSFATDTLTLRRCSKINMAQRWEIEASISPTLSSAEFLVKSVISGSTTPFFTRMPQPPETFSFTENIATLVTGNVAASNESLSVSAGALSGLTLPVGMFVKFSGHSKVYVIKEATGVSSTNNLKVFPPLKKAITAGERMYYGNRVSMAGVFDTNTKIGISYDSGILSSVSGVRIVEYF